MKINYWSDYACPYCYIGETLFRQALEELGVFYDFEMKAFELNSYAKKGAGGDVVAMFAAKYQLDMDEARAKVQNINEIAGTAGLDFDYAKVIHTNTFDAHRLTRFALEKGGTELQSRVAERLYKAYFSDHVDIADPEVLAGIAAEQGLDAAEVAEMLSGKAFSDEVSLDEREAQRSRITSVPCFVINDKVAVPGAMPKEQFKDLIRKYFPGEIPMAI